MNTHSFFVVKLLETFVNSLKNKLEAGFWFKIQFFS